MVQSWKAARPQSTVSTPSLFLAHLHVLMSGNRLSRQALLRAWNDEGRVRGNHPEYKSR